MYAYFILQFFYSHLTYGIRIWGPSLTVHQIGILKKTQKRLVRFICNCKYNAPTDQLFQDLGLLKIEEIIDHNLLVFMSRFMTKQLPAPLLSIFPTNTETHNYSTRFKGEAQIVKCTYEQLYKSFIRKGPFLWSNMDNNLKNLSTHLFPIALKKHILTKQ